MKGVKLVSLTGKITEEKAGDICKELARLDTELKVPQNQTIELIINSGGGYNVTAFGIHDFITKNRIPVTTKGYGRVESAAVIVFLAGKERRLSSHSKIFLHAGYRENVSGTAEELRKAAEDLERTDKIFIQLLIEKTKLTEKEIKRFWNSDGRFFSPKEAFDVGLITDL